jgi:hypothetical protein
MDAGDLVPDELTTKMLIDEVNNRIQTVYLMVSNVSRLKL